jgi:predicted GIY-YIG superfamily endonuclease
VCGSTGEAIKCSHTSNNEDHGYIYAFEFGDGRIKIGRTKNPSQRLDQHARNLEKYMDCKIGRTVVSQPHLNFIENETILKRLFKGRKIKGEVFRATMEDLVRVVDDEIIFQRRPPAHFFDKPQGEYSSRCEACFTDAESKRYEKPYRGRFGVYLCAKCWSETERSQVEADWNACNKDADDLVYCRMYINGKEIQHAHFLHIPRVGDGITFFQLDKEQEDYWREKLNLDTFPKIIKVEHVIWGLYQDSSDGQIKPTGVVRIYCSIPVNGQFPSDAGVHG